MLFERDEKKNRINKAEHGVRLRSRRKLETIHISDIPGRRYRWRVA
jgi:uncharacterized DUF497 family protein